MDDNIDYEKLATLVAHKLSLMSSASVQGQAALDEMWLNQQITSWAINHSTLIARYVFSNPEFDHAFKAKLKATIGNIY
jgi:hypothetical protein